MLGKRVDYKNYLENNWESIWKSLPQDIVNKRFPQLIDKVETTEGKQARAKTKAGRRVFKKKNLTRQEFMDYFLGDDVGASTKGTRKDGLSSAIAETLARDEVMDVLSNPEVASKFEEINKVLELKLPKNWKSYVQKAIDAIDNLSNELNNTAGFMGTPQMMSVFTKALSAGLKAGKNFIDSVIDAIEALRKIYKKGLNPQEQQWTDDHFNHVIEEIRKYMKEPTTESEMKQRLEEIFDPENPIWNVNEQDVNSSQQFMNQMKELAKTDAKIKAVLESQGNKSIWLGSPSKITEDNVSPLDNFAKETDAFLKRIPQSFFNNMLKIKNISKSNLFGFAGQHYNLLDDRGTAKGQLGNYFDILQGRDTSTSPIDTKAAVEAGVMSKETAKAIDDIQWDKVEMMLIKRDKNGKVKSGPLLTKMIDIAEGPGTVAEKKKAIDAAMDSEVGVENIKAFKAIAMMMKDAYNAGTISDSYLLNNLQGQTNVAYSFRSLSKFGGIQLKDGPQPGLINLGEHMNPNSGTMDGLMNWIRDKNSTETQLDEIADKHEQIYGDGRTAKDKNGNINYKDSGTLKKVDLKNPKTGLKLPQTSKLGIERYSKTLTEAEQQSIYFPARGSKVGINLRERIAIERLQKKSIETNKKSAEKVNQQTFGDMDAKTRKNWDKARELARDPNQPQKGITIVDFDDTLATSNSKVIVNMPDGTTKKITPAEFAKQHAALESEDAKFDFSEFNKVIGGKPGPFFNKVQKLADKFGTEQIHILTARPQASAAAIQAFMKGLGIDINIDNIVGLEDGRPEAKRDFIIKKSS